MNEEYVSAVIDDESEDTLEHYGMPRRSGRYPWGSGDNPYQRTGDFLARVQAAEKDGFTGSPEEIKERFQMSTTDYKRMLRLAKHERWLNDVATMKRLRDKEGLSNVEIGKRFGISESSVRSKLDPDVVVNKMRAEKTAEALKKQLKKNPMLDVGRSSELALGVTRDVLDEAVLICELDGYNVYNAATKDPLQFKKQTPTKILANPDVEYKDVYQKPGEIAQVGKTLNDIHSDDGGLTFRTTQYPSSISSDRVAIRYKDDLDKYGRKGIEKDGTLEIRRGVKDLSLGDSAYAQVRILVDGTHYLKGMAVYSDDLPPGVDIVFNTNKGREKSKHEVLKKIHDEDPNNPFGAYIPAGGQSMYIGDDGKEHLSAINKLKEEGDWASMSRNLSQQFLAKQPKTMIKQQLKLTYEDYTYEYDDIQALTNPVVKRNALLKFAESCDTASVNLKAKAFPGQESKVLLPVPTLKDNEIYDPSMRNGDQVALVRYPHGGTFEIPILTVNNGNKQGQELLGKTPRDAVGISAASAERLSGADFDGDHVVRIPLSENVSVKNSKLPKLLVGYDPKTEYPERPGMKYLSKSYKQKQMGIVSNLITDMTLKGATADELAYATRHSMTVIDAEKHKLDYKRSEQENHIEELKRKYQTHIDPFTGKVTSGASTLLSMRKQELEIPETRGQRKIDPETGKEYYTPSGRTYVDKKTGETKLAMKKVSKMAYTDDASIMSSGTIEESYYADFANRMKALANQARKDSLNVGKLATTPEAKAKYAEEVTSLKAAINLARMNEPKERRAKNIANSRIKAIIDENPALKEKENAKTLGKIKQSIMDQARADAGASGKLTRIHVTEREWEAIQNGAITENILNDIIRYSDPDRIRELSMPKTSKGYTSAQMTKVMTLKSRGYSTEEIADMAGLSTFTVNKIFGDAKKEAK